MKPMAFDMFENRNLFKCPLQLLQGKIQSIIVDVLASIFQGLQQDTYLAQITVFC
jgi:hypothetical protein